MALAFFALVTGDLSFLPVNFWCYYLQTLRDLVSPVNRSIFTDIGTNFI